MYPDSSEPSLLSGNNGVIETISSSVYEEKTGLLQRDDIQLHDLLWQQLNGFHLKNWENHSNSIPLIENEQEKPFFYKKMMWKYFC